MSICEGRLSDAVSGRHSGRLAGICLSAGAAVGMEQGAVAMKRLPIAELKRHRFVLVKDPQTLLL